MVTVMNIVKGIVKTMGLTVIRCDIQSYNYGNGIEGYTAYLDAEKDGVILDRLAIHHDGSMEFIK